MCNHDPKFGCFGAKNGCLACQCEENAKIASDQTRRANNGEAQLVRLRQWCIDYYGIDTNKVIGMDGWPDTLVECVIKIIEEDIHGKKCCGIH